MMVSEICNSLKEEKEDASSTNCVLEERDKITLKNKNRNKNKERNAHLRGVPDLFVLFSQSKHRRRLRRRKRERERERESNAFWCFNERKKRVMRFVSRSQKQKKREKRK